MGYLKIVDKFKYSSNSILNYRCGTMDDEKLKLLAFIKISSYRTKTVLQLKTENKTPSQIAKDSGIRITHISNVLRELKDNNMAVCINEHQKRNRIYKLTDLGLEIAQYLIDD